MNRGVLFYLMIPLLLFTLPGAVDGGSAGCRSAVSSRIWCCYWSCRHLLYGGRPGVVWAFVGGLGWMSSAAGHWAPRVWR